MWLHVIKTGRGCNYLIFGTTLILSKGRCERGLRRAEPKAGFRRMLAVCSNSADHIPVSALHYPTMPKQCVNLRLPAAKVDKQFHRIPASATFEDFFQKRLTGTRIEYAIFFKQRIGIAG